MLHHIATISVCYGGHFESKMTAKIQKSSDLGEIWYDPLCRNIHRSMWQLLGVEQIQNGGRWHGNQGTKWPPNTKILRFG